MPDFFVAKPAIPPGTANAASRPAASRRIDVSLANRPPVPLARAPERLKSVHHWHTALVLRT
jgi:hypothetical protein